MLAAYAFVLLAVLAPIAWADVCEECVQEADPPVAHVPEECWSHAHDADEAPTGYEDSCAYLSCEDDHMVVMVSSPKALKHIRIEVVKLDATGTQVEKRCQTEQSRKTGPSAGWPRALLDFPARPSADHVITGPIELPLQPDLSDDYWELQQSFMYNARSAKAPLTQALRVGPVVVAASDRQTTNPGGVVSIPRDSECGQQGSVICDTQYNIQTAVVEVKEYLEVTSNPDIDVVTRKRLRLRCKAQIVQPPPQTFTPTLQALDTHVCRQTAYEISGGHVGDRYEINVNENKHTHTADSQVGWFVSSLLMGSLPEDQIVENGQSTSVGQEIGTSPAKQGAWTPLVTAYSWTTDVVVVPVLDKVDLTSTALYCVHNPVGSPDLCDVPLCHEV